MISRSVRPDTFPVDGKDGEARYRPGTISWDWLIDSSGVIHVIALAGVTDDDGFWYLSVSPTGRVSPPLRLPDASIPDDQQVRHLTLDASGRPVVMVMGKNSVAFYRVQPNR